MLPILILLVHVHSSGAHLGAAPLQANLPPPYATPSKFRIPIVVKPPKGRYLTGPARFHVEEFAVGLNLPRWLLSLPNGDVLCTESYQGRVRLLRDKDSDGVADTYITLLRGLELPFGMALQNGYLYVANTNSVYRYPFKPGQTAIETPPEKIVMGIPSRGWRQHWTRNIQFTPDGNQFYLTVGSETNKGPDAPPRATILRFNADGSGRTTFATGLRNPVGLAIEPTTKSLWVSNVERDYMGEDLVPDFITRVREGDFFGWPWYYIGNHLDPALAKMNPPKKVVNVPDILVTSHSVPLGIVFYKGSMFPKEYRGDLFVAMRGSTNRTFLSGYQVSRVRLKNGRPLPGVQPFISGWVPDRRKREVYGRPVGLAVWKDGSLLITDESANKIWRVSYR